MKIDIRSGDVLVNNASRAAPRRGAIRVVDLIFAGELDGRARRLAAGAAIVLALYGGVLTAVSLLGRSAGPWSTELAARVHDAIAAERAVDLTPPPPQPPPLPAARTASPVAAVAPPRAARAPHAARARPAASAQPGQVAAASAAPFDFTGSAFVVGSAPAYAGGTTATSGTSGTARGAVLPDGAGDGSGAPRSRARAVSLDQAAWNCPWPAEADAQQVNEQTVVLRVEVGPDGRATNADILADPGFGFGVAARLCALRTRFEAARDLAGQPVASLSPPIRVHFFR